MMTDSERQEIAEIEARCKREADMRAAELFIAPMPKDGCTHFFPERGVGCKLCEEYFAHRDKLDADPREMERQERLNMEIENKTLRIALEQVRQIIKDTIGDELEL